jgi:hypothetical protein
MNKSILTIGVILAITASSTLFISCSSNSYNEDEATEQQDADAGTATIVETTHSCPMHPAITGIEGDTCSKCGMDLVAADGEASDDDAEITSTHSCPMHPAITGLEGDKCSKCGMDLTLAEVGNDDSVEQQ